ncbi:MAG: S41 family peptidase [candidate division Zixibacteria bacterium]|nr:S41 family peptidase [candidate division Zixibacteria bacterium]MBU1472112.1 S41 family peptidase [candidate division Zixibacteria bacterium]
MNEGRKTGIYALMLTMTAIALVWLVGSGQAEPNYASGELLVQTQSIDQTADDTTENLATREKTILYYTRLLVDMAYNIHSRYMEDVSPKDLAYAGVKGMLEDLDPFSVLMEKQSYDQLMENTHGMYQGLGMQIGKRGDYITVIAPMEGTPAYKVGLTAGDLVIAINGEDTKDMTVEDASILMRGTAGTSVTLTVKRPGYDEELDYLVTRDEIPLYSVNYAGIVQGNIGYVRLSRFAETTEDELISAIDSLQKETELEGLIFDLRSNGGGLLSQAIQTANLFLDRNKLVVYTRGRLPSSERRYSCEGEALYQGKPLVVLVDGGSASASEIVAGAIQDWDRGIIIGNTTFGKGLVQQIFGGTGESDVALKLTTAKYYVPSGRCIQKPERSKKHPDEITELDIESDSDEIDEDREIFYTNGGRIVYGGGGIVPDIDVDREKWQPIDMNLERQSMFFNFAVDYTSRHKNIPRDFEVTDEIFSEFVAFCKESKFEYRSQMELSLDDFENAAKDAEKEDLFDKDIEKIRSIIEGEKESDFQASKDYIDRRIKREIVRKEFGERGVYEELVLKADPYVQKALEILSEKKRYSELLKAGHSIAGDS